MCFACTGYVRLKIGIVVLIFSGSSYVVEVAWYVLGYVVEVVYRVTSWK